MKMLHKNKLITNGIVSALKKQVNEYYLPHRHDFFEIEYIISGNGTYSIDGNTYSISPNTVFLVTPANIHSVDTENTEMINIMFPCEIIDGDILYRLITNMPSLAFTVDGDNAALIRLLAQQVVLCASEGRNTDAVPYLNCILRKLGELSSSTNKKAVTYISKAILFMLENYTRSISEAEVAKHIGLSETYFCELFSKEVGINYKKYLDELRFSYIEKLLALSDMPVMLAYEESGFSDYANFSRRFRKRTGMSPSEFRAESKKRYLTP